MKGNLLNRRSVLTGLGVEADVGLPTKIGEYDSYRAGMLRNQRPDGSFTSW